MTGTRKTDSCRVLGFLAEELGGLPERIAALEGQVSALANGSSAGSEAVVALQDLDLLRQTLHDLSRLAAAARDGGPDRNLGPLAAAMTLHDLRSRLINDGGRTDRLPSESGQLEQFRTIVRS